MKHVPLLKPKAQPISKATPEDSTVAQLSMVNSVQPAINATDTEDAMANDLARVQDILFGTTTRQLEQKLIELELTFKKATEQLQDQFTSSVAELREESRLVKAEQQRLIAENRAEVVAYISETAANLTAVHQKSEKQAAVALASARKSIDGQLYKHAAELQKSQVALQESKVDRNELATLLGQMAKQIGKEEPPIQKAPDGRKH